MSTPMRRNKDGTHRSPTFCQRQLKRFPQRPGELLANATLFVTFLCVSLVGGEASLRIYHWFRNGIPFFTRSSENHDQSLIVLDDQRGWRATENVRVQTLMKNADGSEYRVTLSQDEHGFRLFGDLTAVGSRRPRVLVIGDSFTHAREVSDSKTYYAILRASFDAEVFAYGVGGYGTLQEYMALAEYFTMIKPDLIIWQYCPNDFINNSAALESRSTANNNGMRRPYLVNGRIEYVLPKPYTRLVREYAIRYSRFLYFVISRVDRLLAVSSRASALERDIETKGLEMPEFTDAVLVTDQIMGRARRLVGDVRILAFSSQGGVSLRMFADISSKHDIDFLASVPDVLRAAEERGIVITTADRAHWNEAGHRIVAGVLATALKERCLIDLCLRTNRSRQ
jgi:hypothetical protein